MSTTATYTSRDAPSSSSVAAAAMGGGTGTLASRTKPRAYPHPISTSRAVSNPTPLRSPSRPNPSRAASPLSSLASTPTTTYLSASSSSPGPGSPSPPEEYVIALHSYTPPEGMSTCIAFKAGDVILVHSRDQGGWWDGSLGLERGWFPSNYVSGDLGGVGAWGEGGGSGSGSAETSMVTIDTPSLRSTPNRTPTQTSPRPSSRTRATATNTTLSPPLPITHAHHSPNSSTSSTLSFPHSATSLSLHSHPSSPTSSSHSHSHPHASRPGTLSSVSKALALLTRAARARRAAHYGPATACVISAVRSVLTAAECLERSSPVLAQFEDLKSVRKELLARLGLLVRVAKEAQDGGGAAGDGAAAAQEDDAEQEERVRRMVGMAEEVLMLVTRLVEVALRCGIDVPGAVGLGSGVVTPAGGSSAEVSMMVAPPLAAQPTAAAAALSSTPVPPPPQSLQPQHPSYDSSESSASASRPARPRVQAAIAAHRAKSLLDLRNAKRRGEERDRAQEAAEENSVLLRRGAGEEGYDSGDSSAPLVSAGADKGMGSAEKRRMYGGGGGVDGEGAGGSGSGRKRTDRARAGSSSTSGGSSSGLSLGSLGSLSSLSASSAGAHTPTQGAAGDTTTLSAQLPSPVPGPLTLSPAQLNTLLRHSQDASVSLVAALIGQAQTHTSQGHAASHARLVEVAADAVGKLREAMWVVDSVAAHLASRTAAPPGGKPSKGVERLVNARRGLYRIAVEIVDAAAGLTSGGSGAGEGLAGGEEERKERLTKKGFEALRALSECVVATKMCLVGALPGETVLLEELTPVDTFVRGGVVGTGPSTSGPNLSISVTASPLGPGGRPTSARKQETLDALAVRAARLLSLREEYLDEEDEEEVEEELEANELVEQAPQQQQGKVEDGHDTLRPRQPSGKEPAILGQTQGSASSESTHASSSTGPSDFGHSRSSSAQTSSQHSHLHSHSLSYRPRPPVPLRIIVAPNAGPHDGPASDGFRRVSEDSMNDMGIPLRSPTAYIDPSRSQAPFLPSMRTISGTLDSGRPSLEEKLVNGRLPAVPERNEPVSTDPNEWLTRDDESPADVMIIADQTVVGGTLEALVKRMTPHNVTPELSFAASFFMTFRLFTTPPELVEVLIRRWEVPLPTPPGPTRPLTSIERQVWHDRMLVPIRLRVLNFVKTWLESHWRAETDEPALAPLQFFVDQTPDGILKAASRRISDLIVNRRLRPQSMTNKYAATVSNTRPNAPRLDRTKSFDRLRSATPLPFGNGSSSSAAPPAPTVSRSLYAAIRSYQYSSISVTDFDPLELARQLSIMESKLYMAIQPNELLELGKPGAPPAINVKAISGLSTAITGLVAESVLSEQDIKKRAALLKYYIKVSERAAELKNYSLVFSILAALTSSTIKRLRRTWEGLSNKYSLKLAELLKITDYSKNYSEYRNRLRETEPSAIPFLGVYLTDITFCNGGNPSYRASPIAQHVQLINFNKYRKLARIVADMQRFQKPYNLLEIGEAQSFLQHALQQSRSSGDLQDLYRRSLLIEPRESTDAQHSETVKTRTDIFGWATRSLGQSNQTNSTVSA